MKKEDERSERIIRKNNEEYYKQIRDIIPLLAGITNLYSIDAITSCMKEVLESSNDLDYDIQNDMKNDFENHPIIIDILDDLNSKKL